MSKLPTFTYQDIVSWDPCYDPIKFLSKDWEGTAIDILKMGNIPAKDRLWAVLREECIDAKTLRLFAVWNGREALSLSANPDARSIEALNVAERYANGEATKEELKAAKDAAKDAAEDAAWAAAWAAARDAAWAARAAARAAAWAAARDAAEDAAKDAAKEAAWAARAAAWETQVQQLIKILEGGLKNKSKIKPAPVSQSQFQKHMARLEETFERWKNSGDDSINFYNSGMISALGGFFHKYRNHQTPTPGRFVPESEIEKLSIAVDGGYLSDLPFIIRDFLKAIDRKKDSDG